MSETKLSKTFKEVAEEWLETSKVSPELMKDGDQKIVVSEIVLSFAKHLDSFQTLDAKLELLAMRKSREIDGEVLLAFAKELPKEKVEEIIRGVYEKHRHTKNAEA